MKTGQALISEIDATEITAGVVVEIHRGRLVIRGERRRASGERLNFHSRECSCGRFYRKIPLPENVDIENADVTVRNGTLTIRFPWETRENEMSI